MNSLWGEESLSFRDMVSSNHSSFFIYFPIVFLGSFHQAFHPLSSFFPFFCLYFFFIRLVSFNHQAPFLVVWVLVSLVGMIPDWTNSWRQPIQLASSQVRFYHTLSELFTHFFCFCFFGSFILSSIFVAFGFFFFFLLRLFYAACFFSFSSTSSSCSLAFSSSILSRLIPSLSLVLHHLLDVFLL